MKVTFLNNWSSIFRPNYHYGNLFVFSLITIGFMLPRKDAKPTRKVKKVHKGLVLGLLGFGVIIGPKLENE